MNWAQFARMFELWAMVLRSYGTELPPARSKESSTEAADCDEWCQRLAADPQMEKIPPAHVRPWMLARLLSAASLAHNLAKSKEPIPKMTDHRIVVKCLVDEWHGRLKDLWPLADRDQSSFGA